MCTVPPTQQAHSKHRPSSNYGSQVYYWRIRWPACLPFTSKAVGNFQLCLQGKYYQLGRSVLGLGHTPYSPRAAPKTYPLLTLTQFQIPGYCECLRPTGAMPDLSAGYGQQELSGTKALWPHPQPTTYPSGWRWPTP